VPNKYIKKILESAVYDVAVETPIHKMHFLSASLKNEVLVKREDLQPIYSFKVRGAQNKIARLTDAEKKRGVIAASAGNHAQGVAISATRNGVKSVIVMPLTTPQIKILSVKRLGGKVILYGSHFDECCEYAKKLAKKKDYVFIHPYEDPDVIAGQGTVAMEILRQHSADLHAIFIPVGGGGLIAGMGAYIKYLRPGIKVIGVEAEDSACLLAAMKAGRRVTLPKAGLFADGVAVSRIGKEPFRIARKCVDDVVTVTHDQICAAVKELFDDTRSIAEPAGALALAGLKKYATKKNLKDRTLMAIESGANVNFDRLRYIAERYEVGERTEVVLGVTIPEKPESLKAFCKALHKHDITAFNYRFCGGKNANIFVRLQVMAAKEDREKLFGTLNKKGYKTVDFSDDELAKSHIDRMVGGRSDPLECEALYRVECPECQGALLKLLDLLKPSWNISLFNYRKSGGAYANVLIGIQMPAAEQKKFEKAMTSMKYIYHEESDNVAYRMFLR
jgi:threonine dehydratase